jgi:casein kinase II subunit alpha
MSHLFLGDDNADQLVEITKTLGTDNLFKYVQKYNITIDEKEHKNLKKSKYTGFEKFVKPEN